VFGKIVALILSLGIFACALLAVRQARIQAFHELTQTRLRIRAQDERLWELRTQIAARVTPDHIHEMAAARRKLKPMLDDRPGDPRPLPPAEPLYDDQGRPAPAPTTLPIGGRRAQ
jgi:hypothetical protein